MDLTLAASFENEKQKNFDWFFVRVLSSSSSTSSVGIVQVQKNYILEQTTCFSW